MSEFNNDVHFLISSRTAKDLQLTRSRDMRDKWGNLSYQHLSPARKAVGVFRRKSCRCTECGTLNKFQDRVSVLFPKSMIKALQPKKRKFNRGSKRGQLRIASGKQLRKQEVTTPASQKLSTSPRRNNKVKTILHKSKGIMNFSQQMKRQISQDDFGVVYESQKGIITDLDTMQGTNDTAAASYFKNFAYCDKPKIGVSIRSINESSQMSEILNPNQIPEGQPTLKAPLVLNPIVLRKKMPIHSRKMTECIMQVNKLLPNRTLEKYIANNQKSLVSPRTLKIQPSSIQSSPKSHTVHQTILVKESMYKSLASVRQSSFNYPPPIRHRYMLSEMSSPTGQPLIQMKNIKFF